MLQRLRAVRPARLSAIEIAEGALLADIAVVFQLLSIYLPIGGGYPALMVPIPFAILVLRRGLYAGIMGFCVALFLIAVLTGPASAVLMGLEAGAGLFLGVTMRYRLPDFLLVLLGVTCCAFLVFGVILLANIVAGVPFTRMIISIHKSYLNGLIVLGFISTHVGLSGWWQHSAYPFLFSLTQVILTYWLLVVFLATWTVLWPVVIVVYFITNFFVRLLGYDVRPFPGGVIDRLFRSVLRLIIRLAIRLGLGNYWLTRSLIKDVSLQVGRGEYVVILGHNGSGKSTLARHCNALLSPGSGRVLVGGMDTADQANWRAIRDIVGMIFQNPDNQIIATVVEDDVTWALTVRGLPASLIRERVAYAMTAVGIADMGKLPPHQLSGGQRQRLAIAGVLALRPQCIIADEATAQLDPLSRMEIVTLLHQLRLEYGLTIIQVTHLLEEAALAERVVIMEQGQVVMDGDPASVFADLERLRRLKLAIPEPVELAARLRAAGISISQKALTTEAIARELAH